ncbi:MAG: Prepilin-type cleavage/methylation-like protein [Pseudomonadota bacterium]|jgi:type IV pilus assembly protein PilW
MKNKSLVPQRGFNIVELMISITIGLVMIVFVTSLYVRSKGAYEVNDDNSRMQQEGRLIMSMIGRNISQAGFGQPVSFSSSRLVSTFHQASDNPQAFRVCDGGFVAPTNLNNTACVGGTGAAGFEVSYIDDSTPNTNTGAGSDCNGQAVPLDTRGFRRVINRFYLTGTPGNLSLNCIGNGSATSQPLLSNVEGMRLRFGVIGNNLKQVTGMYNTAADVLAVESTINPPVEPFSRVASVEVCLQLTSATKVNQKNEQTYVDCRGATVTPTDRRIHMALTSVFTLRNNADSTLLSYGQ